MPAIAEKAAALCEREEELLLQCARWRIDDNSLALIAGLVHDGIQWQAVHTAARRHGIVPQLYAALSTSPGGVPEGLLADLKAECDGNTVRNLAMSAEVVRVLRTFEHRGVAALAYKGPALALQVYGSLGARQFGDLDILVRREEIATARSVLGDIGYTGDPWPSIAAEEAYMSHGHVHAFRGPRSERLELHWEFMPPELSVRLNVDEIWSRFQRIRVGDVCTLALAPEDLLLVLCVHGCRHVWTRLKEVCDVAQVFLRLPLDWRTVVERAQRMGALRMLYLGLVLSRDLLHVSIGSELDKMLDADPAVRMLGTTVRQQLFAPSLCQPTSPEARLFHSQLGGDESHLA